MTLPASVRAQVQVFSAHSMPEDRQTLAVVYPTSGLAPSARDHAGKLLAPNSASIVRLGAVEAPRTAHSEELGGFYRRELRPRDVDASSSALEFVPVLYVEPLDGEEVDGFVRLHYPMEGGVGVITPAEVCRNIEVAQKMLSGSWTRPAAHVEAGAKEEEEAAVAPVEAEEVEVGEAPLIWHSTAPAAAPPRSRGERMYALTEEQAEREYGQAVRQYLGEVAGTHGAHRPVPPIALAGDRIMQRAVSSLLFARPSEIHLADVTLGAPIGSLAGGASGSMGTHRGGGGFGRVLSARFRGKRVAARVLTSSRRHGHEALLAVATQAEHLQQIRSEHVVRVLGARTTLPKAFLLMEHAEHGSLAELVHSPNVRPLELVLQLNLLRDAARGMRHLHRHAARHFNLRASNVMLYASPLRAKVRVVMSTSRWLPCFVG